MTKHMTGTRKEWLAARLELLEAEKELTRRSDELARRRQELPWVRIDKEYRFETDEGSASLADLFRGRSQLLVYHFMFGPDYTAGCPSCSAIADGFDGFVVHLANHDVTLWRCRGRRSRSCRRTSGGWGGRFPGRPRSAATSTSTSTSGSPRSSSSARGHRIQLPARARRCAARPGGRRRRRRRRHGGHDRNRRGHVHAREAGHERVRARGRRRLPHATPPMRADWTASGACTSGSTAHPRDATRRASGGAATTSTASAERSRDRGGATKGPGRSGGIASDRAPGQTPSRRLRAALRRQRGGDDLLVRVHVGDGRDADARRLDDVDGVDADARSRRGPAPRRRSSACGS